MTADTRILDATLAILRGSPAAKRAPRKGITVDVLMSCATEYSIQVGPKVLVANATGTKEEAMADAKARAERLRALTGKPVTISLYD